MSLLLLFRPKAGSGVTPVVVVGRFDPPSPAGQIDAASPSNAGAFDPPSPEVTNV